MNKLKRFSLPYLIILIVFIAIPMITMIALSFMTTEGLHFSNAVFTFANFSRLTEISVIVGLWNSLKYATIATLACLVLGYPLAYIFSRSKNKNGSCPPDVEQHLASHQRPWLFLQCQQHDHRLAGQDWD
ncbi:MAG: hypothetical protein NTV44_03710 [Firmicutes bacterium]|nr:hypothetical protein [Bacillota bacterium]